jgi:hypothetical protein
MSEGQKGVGGGTAAERDAAGWVAENQSDRALEEVTVSLWEEWVARVENQVEYVAVIDVVEGLRGLPAPALDSREALVRDALRDGAEVGRVVVS